jgi:competence protein ComEC
MPLLVLLLINPNFYNLFKAPFNLFSFVISKLSSINNLLIHVKELNPIFIIIFYLLLFFTLVEIEEKKSFKNRFVFLIYISSLILLNKNYISYVSMINVSQGDSFLVNDNNKYLVIDSYNSNIEYIEKENVKEIDTMIITHSDNDHIGSALELAKRHYINNLYFNYYETSEVAKELTKYAKRTRYLKKGDIVYFGKNRIDVLGPIKESDNINNNSLVFILNFKGKKILFTGDSELEEEMDIYDKNYDVDIVKIAHHGSKTSTSDYFMNHVSFDIALISVGENNKYNHPDIETINKLKEKEIYMTKDMNSVKIYFYQNKCFIYPSIYNKILLSTLDKLTRPLFNFKI